MEDGGELSRANKNMSTKIALSAASFLPFRTSINLTSVFCYWGPWRLREGFQITDVKFIDVPNGRKDAADKAILVNMFLFALVNSPPSSIMLIYGDVDFAPALHILGQ